MSISRLRRINNMEKGRLRWPPRTEGISSRIATITIYHREILRGTLDQLLLK